MNPHWKRNMVNIYVLKEAVALKSLDVGNSTKKLLLKLSSDLKSEFLSDAKEFYVNIAKYLQEKLPLKNRLLKILKILHPVLKKEPYTATLPSVRCLANILSQVIPEDCVDKLTDEWKIYSTDDAICEEWSFEETWQPIDYYWKNVLSMMNDDQLPKYRYLSTLVKAILTFSHGQASVERGFSVNKRMLTSERASLSLDTVIGLRLIKYAVMGGKAKDACITN